MIRPVGTAARRGAAALAAAAVAGALVGCTDVSTPAETSSTPVIPIESVATDVATTTPTAEVEPTTTDDTPEPTPEPSTSATSTGGGTTQATASAATDHVKIGTNDFSVLEWRVVCTGLDAEPSVLATAEGDDGTKYVIMILADRDRQLISLSFSSGPPNAGHSAKSGLTVTPATGQGAGTFLESNGLVSSDGRGVSYGPYDQDFSVDTTYSIELRCPSS